MSFSTQNCELDQSEIDYGYRGLVLHGHDDIERDRWTHTSLHQWNLNVSIRYKAQSHQFSVSIKCSTNITESFEVAPTETIREIKLTLQRRTRIPPHNMTIKVNGQPVSNDDTIQSLFYINLGFPQKCEIAEDAFTHKNWLNNKTLNTLTKIAKKRRLRSKGKTEKELVRSLMNRKYGNTKQWLNWKSSDEDSTSDDCDDADSDYDDSDYDDSDYDDSDDDDEEEDEKKGTDDRGSNNSNNGGKDGDESEDSDEEDEDSDLEYDAHPKSEKYASSCVPKILTVCSMVVILFVGWLKSNPNLLYGGCGDSEWVDADEHDMTSDLVWPQFPECESCPRCPCTVEDNIDYSTYNYTTFNTESAFNVSQCYECLCDYWYNYDNNDAIALDCDTENVNTPTFDTPTELAAERPYDDSNPITTEAISGREDGDGNAYTINTYFAIFAGGNSGITYSYCDYSLECQQGADDCPDTNLNCTDDYESETFATSKADHYYSGCGGTEVPDAFTSPGGVITSSSFTAQLYDSKEYSVDPCLRGKLGFFYNRPLFQKTVINPIEDMFMEELYENNRCRNSEQQLELNEKFQELMSENDVNHQLNRFSLEEDDNPHANLNYSIDLDFTVNVPEYNEMIVDVSNACNINPLAQHPRIFPIEEEDIDEDEQDEDEQDEPELNGPMEVLAPIMEGADESSTPDCDDEIDEEEQEEENDNPSFKDHISDNSLRVKTGIIDSNSTSTNRTPNVIDESEESEENGDEHSSISNLSSHDKRVCDDFVDGTYT